MAVTDDPEDRVPVVLAAASRAGDVALAVPSPSRHAIGCACCGARDPLALALARLFIERARGARRWFDRVTLTESGPGDAARLDAVLRGDPVTRARYRPG